jgi:glutamate-1-semialdehyde aminotransferase
MDRYKESLKYLARARKVMPGGAQTLSKMAVRFPEGAFPVALSRGRGARVWDVDGNEYVDWICALGAVTLGYGKLENSNLELQAMSLPHNSELELAERLCDKIPCAEMVRFVNSGSEATEAAIRTARIATGRDVILTVKSGYHSWHSWFQAVKDWHPGVPTIMETLISRFQYNELESLRKQFEWFKKVDWQLDSEVKIADGVAAVIMEPCLFEKPNDGFLQGVRDLCTQYGALLIFDEMVTGYRWSLAGGQEYFKVTPDLATYGKAMANGLPIGMLCGKREYMQHAELISGTFGGNPLSLAAANSVMDCYEQDDIISIMWTRGGELQDVFNMRANYFGIPAVCDGYPCKPRIRFTHGDETINQKAMALFLQTCALHGVLFHPGGFNVSAALTDWDMEQTFNAIEAGLLCVRQAILRDDWSGLEGQLCKPVLTVRQ